MLRKLAARLFSIDSASVCHQALGASALHPRPQLHVLRQA
jgi:hypothetical protein